MTDALLSLGSNLGDRAAFIESALDRLRRSPGIQALRASRCYETVPAGGPGNQQRFLNAAAVVTTSLCPESLLELLHRVESEAGRQRNERWEARVLDLDLLLFDRETRTTPNLLLPHPRLSFRRFVLEPAVEIAADMIFPPTEQPLSTFLRWLNEQSPLIALWGPPEIENVAAQVADEWRSFANRSHPANWECLYSAAPHELKPLPRLVVVVSDWLQLPSWISAWRGPRLILPAGSTHEEIRREVIAARIAME